MKVLYKNIPDYSNLNSATVERGKCPGIVKSLHIEVLHASIGTFANPQTKIVGVLYKFGQLSDELFSCVGLACNHRLEITFRLLEHDNFYNLGATIIDWTSACPSPTQT